MLGGSGKLKIKQRANNGKGAVTLQWLTVPKLVSYLGVEDDPFDLAKCISRKQGDYDLYKWEFN